MKIVCCSDTHGQHRNIEIPNGDMFIFAGDFEIRNVRDLWIMSNWLNELPHKYVVTIFGNHDFTDDMDIKY
jgi:predicted phosphodiesterase